MKRLSLFLLSLAGVFLADPDLAARTHTVRKGETLSTIATQYGLDAASLARENRLGDADLVMVGQVLEIPTSAAPYIEYRVQKGESLGPIAARFGITAKEISSSNNLKDDDFLKVGQVLRIPNRYSTAATYTVKKGDSLANIAAAQGIPADELARANGIKNANLVQVGQVLVLPGVTAPVAVAASAPPAPRDPEQEQEPAATIAYTVRKGDVLAEIAQDQGVHPAVIAEANNLVDANLLQVGQVLIIPGGQESAVDGSPPVAQTKYTVRKGDNLASIAGRHGLGIGAIARANNLKDSNLLVVGQELTIPTGEIPLTAYTVRKGESLGSIAARHRISVSDILAHNNLARPDRIVPGQVLLLPTDLTIQPPALKPAYPVLPSSVKKKLDGIKVKAGQWKHIVIHHSGMDRGSAKIIDRYHREERRMENGMAYHFVIGNGNGMKDGEIEIGGRWKKQIEGGHLAIHALNLNSIGICLIGNFEQSRPTTRQLNSLEALVRYLEEQTRLPDSAVTTHKLIHPKHTLCPGRHFPTDAFENRLRK